MSRYIARLWQQSCYKNFAPSFLRGRIYAREIPPATYFLLPMQKVYTHVLRNTSFNHKTTRTCIFLNILIHILFRHWVFTFWFLIQNTLFNHEFWYTQFVCVHSTNIVSILLEATKNVPRVTESFILIRDISTKIILNLLIIYFSILIIPRQRNMKNGRNSTLTTLIFGYTALTNKLSYKYSSCEIVLQPRAKLLHNSSQSKSIETINTILGLLQLKNIRMQNKSIVEENKKRKENEEVKTSVTRVNKILTLQLSRDLGVKISIRRICARRIFLRDNGIRRYLSGFKSVDSLRYIVKFHCWQVYFQWHKPNINSVESLLDR